MYQGLIKDLKNLRKYIGIFEKSNPHLTCQFISNLTLRIFRDPNLFNLIVHN